MSLFNLREYWSTRAGDVDDCCAIGCLANGRLLSEKQRDQLVVGTHAGLICVYDPGATVARDANVSNARELNFKASHVLVDCQLQAPIIQVLCGRFVSNAERDYIAVLHSRKLSVFSVNGAMSSHDAETGNLFVLSKAYEHQLPRAAYNMVHGNFGEDCAQLSAFVNVKDDESTQSLDGVLSIYEQDVFTFSRFLPGALLPGPLAYAATLDAFITTSSTWHVHCYKYRSLAVAQDSHSKSEAATVTIGKRVAADWTFELGENAVRIDVLEMSPAQHSIIVLGERTIFCLTYGGTMRFTRRLDYHALYVLAYMATSDGSIQYLTASDTQTLMFYADCQLKWTAKLPLQPVAVIRCTLSTAHRGMLAVLDADGRLMCGYLGTDPALFGLPQTENRFGVDDELILATSFRHVDVEARRKELQRLQSAIKQSSNNPQLQSTQRKGELTLTCTVDANLDEPSHAYDTMITNVEVPSITLRITLVPKGALENVHCYIVCASPLAPHQNAFNFNQLDQRQELPVTVFLRHIGIPSSLNAEVCVVYTSATGARRTQSANVQLPLKLIACSASPSKNAVHKITLDSILSVVNLNDLFCDIEAPYDETGTSFGFHIFGQDNINVTVLASKNNNKYRLQSETFEALYIFAYDLVQRLKSINGQNNALSFVGAFPLQEYFALLDHHFDLLTRFSRLETVLDKRCQMLRSVEKLLLTKFKDTSTTPLSHIDALLDMTHRQVLSLASTLQELQEHIRQRSSALAAATRLMLLLIQLHTQSDSAEMRRLEAAFSPLVDMFFEQTWEQRVSVSLSYIVQVLQKGHAAISPAGPVLQANQCQVDYIPGISLPKLSDTSRVKKHIELLIEKLSSGAHLPAQSEELTAKTTPKLTTRQSMKAPARVLDVIAEDTSATDLSETHDNSQPLSTTFTTLQTRPNGMPETIHEESESELVDSSLDAKKASELKVRLDSPSAVKPSSS